MKTRILFVDDEVLLLNGMRRLLHPMEQEWEMEFFDSAVNALERMKEASFDVIISDMRMPGMNGAEFLNEVLRCYPHTIRFILSGNADLRLVCKSLGSIHQGLTKPCNLEALKAVVLRASKLKSALRSDQLEAILGRIDRLPSIPALYLELVELMQDPEVSIDEIGALVAKDLGMTAKVLKLVNSAFFGIQRRVSSPAAAASYLGVEMIRSLVLSIHAFSQFDQVKLEGFSVETLWSHSLQTAAAARTIARLEGADRRLYEEAFAAGTLHDVGKLILAANFPELYREVLRLRNVEHMDGCKAEEQVFGANHANVGGYLLGLWGLPVSVVDAITMHHEPDCLGQPIFSPLTAVHAANAILHRLQGEEGSALPALDLPYLAELGLAGCPPQWTEAVQEELQKEASSATP
jgi:putative nucleotidyltransferase with HDIG domain